MGKPPLRKYFNPLWFVFLTAFVFCVSFLFLDYYLTLTDRRITILLLNTNDAKHSQLSKPSSFSVDFSETNGCPIKTSHYTNQNNVTDRASNIPRCVDNVELVTKVHTNNLDPCSGKYIYVYDLPSRFNEDLLKGCHSLSKWVDMCPYMSNLGLGPKVIEKSNEEVLLNGSWYATNQFSLEVIFHNTMKHYKCLTNDSSLASAIYVPYYAGLDVGQYLWGFNVSTRDASPKELVKWLAQQPEWKRMLGRDHFIVGGRIGSDFRRMTDTEKKHDWGTKLMFLPEASNMSMLLIESVASYDNDFPIPYPTYFHPSKDMEIFQWQQRMRIVKRPYLFSFAGAPRPSSSSSMRNDIIKHCQSSRSCNFLGCFDGNCDDPVHVMKVFQSSVFCLQPPGDSFTRRSTFDSILAGCIPVFFDPRSAYDQYLWHFPENGSSYSVYIPESDVKGKRVMINETLSMVSESEVLAMREEVIKLIPRIIYRDPSSSLETIEDAFDIAVKGILGRIEALRRDITNVNNSVLYPELYHNLLFKIQFNICDPRFENGIHLLGKSMTSFDVNKHHFTLTGYIKCF
ncbi:probable xyloglucan galactosyltransferase GT12 [Gastrolobium bilobum]|uniref:probable xyloglucan galactosyltransferase GT12 n=1 Tax=Gastrolobium bilobum TaxID=150636 RepID=UPI002AAF7336|nr:probable xyloglucan galactosyltransferase GT12 [Gastrolobium bilobum]